MPLPWLAPLQVLLQQAQALGRALLKTLAQVQVQVQALVQTPAPEIWGALPVSALLTYCSQPLQMKLSRGKAGTG
jgi:hypothetical protein